jgi:PIN domain nuclease of toxin-antitoxin system
MSAKIRMTDPAISVISIWEAMMLLERGRLESPVSPEQTIRGWLRENSVDVLDVTSEIAILSRTLTFDHNDPADRFIAATSFQLGVPLATTDANLLSLPWLAKV